MKELFKWIACHPDVTLTIEHDRYKAFSDYGALQITMKHKSWCVASREIILFDLIDVATNPDAILISTLDRHYMELIKVKEKSIDQRIDEILEVHNENLEHE